MSGKFINKNLVNYISLLVTFAVIMALVGIGFYFNSFLKRNFLENTREQMEHSFQRLSDNLLTVEKELQGVAAFARNNEPLIASIELVNTYQDKQDYNTFLIDEEKKTIAQKLLDQLKLTFNTSIFLYDSNSELQVFVSKTDQGFRLNYITYDKGRLEILSRLEDELAYSPLNSSHLATVQTIHQRDKALDKGTSYLLCRKVDDSLAVTLHQDITDNGKMIAHLETTKILDANYFASISKDFGIKITYSKDPHYTSEASPMAGSKRHQVLKVVETANGYHSVMRRESRCGPIFFIASGNNVQLNRVLEKNRSQLFFLLVLIAMVILLLMRFLINRTIARPLTVVMKQIERIGDQKYRINETVTTGNELETISKSINNLARVVQEREAQLSNSANQIRTLVETLPDLIWQKDAHGRFILCNKKVTRLYGVPQSELIGKTDHELLPAALAKSLQEEDRATIAAGVPCRFESKLTYADDGHQEITETIKMPLFNAEGELDGLLGIGRNITDRKRAEDTLRRSEKMDAIGQLTGGIAHDFNNILGVIIGNIDLLAMDLPATHPELEQTAENIRVAAERASKLTQQLLGFSREHTTEIAPVDLNTTIIKMEDMIARSLTPSIEVVKNFTEDLWLTDINTGDFQDVLINMMLNARDAMGDKGTLTLETGNIYLDNDFCEYHKGSIPGPYVELVVSDNGCGIPRNLQEKVFEPFFTTKEQGKGTGLGLSMVFGFIKRSKGYITLYSEPGIGTTFRLYLPRSQQKAKKEDALQQYQDSIPRGSETVLMVDDETALLELAKVTLENLGYSVLTATDGPSALEVLTLDPDIAILVTDVVMPRGMNGYELASQATADNPKLKVLLCSGYSKNVMVANGFDRFSTNLLSKPYTQAMLARRIRATLDRR